MKEWKKRNPIRTAEHAKKWKQKSRLSPKTMVRLKLWSSRDNSKKYGYSPCTTSAEEIATRYTTKCEICGADKGSGIHLDHCHKTGKFRGFLCTNCNHVLGSAKDDPDILLRAITYLSQRG